MIERELKLALPERFTVPALSLDGAPLEAVALPGLTLRATYYDTPDLRLARHGASLRHRVGEERGPIWTLKLPVTVNDGVIERRELDLEGSPREPPAEARVMVTALARSAPLVAVATLRTQRRRLRLDHDGSPVAELVDDEVSVLEGRRVVSRFRELEVEALEPSLDLDALAGQLREAGATDAEPVSKVVRALGSRATAPPDVRPAEVDDDATMGDVLVVAIADALVRLVRHDPMARLGDAEGIHQVRVAVRRLRSDLTTLGEAVDDQWRAGILPRLRELGTALGDARDLDVLAARLAAELGGRRPPLGRLRNEIAARRKEAGRRLAAALDDPAYPALLDELLAATSSPPAGPRAGVPARTELRTVLRAVWGRLERRADRLHSSSPDEDFHAARIAAKRARYASELAARVLAGARSVGAAALAERLAEVQDCLGRIQDAAVAEGVLRATLEGPRVSAAYAFEAGRLVERMRRGAVDARAEFLDRWPKVRRRRWRAWAS